MMHKGDSSVIDAFIAGPSPVRPILRGVAVKAIVRPPEDLPLRDRKAVPDDAEYLMDYGIQVVFRSGFHQKFTVIDGRISWYGSVNILSFGKSEESIMRLESHAIAGELIDTVMRPHDPERN